VHHGFLGADPVARHPFEHTADQVCSIQHVLTPVSLFVE
jgi:hypothetical protein